MPWMVAAYDTYKAAQRALNVENPDPSQYLTDQFVNETYTDASGNTVDARGKPSTKITTEAQPVTTQPTGTSQLFTPVTGRKFQDTEQYKTLTPEEREVVDLLFNTISLGGEEEAARFSQAIQSAMAIADPWEKAKIAMYLAEFAGNVSEEIFSYEAKTEAIQRARNILAEDVARNKDFLSLGQQAEIARETRRYDEDLLTIADQAAEKGLTFATGARSRALAEERRGEQYQDVIQSGQREYNFRIKQLELDAARGNVAAQKQLDFLLGQKNLSLQKIGRAAEEILGSSGVPAISGYTPVGGVTGTLEEEKERRIISDVGGTINLTNALTEGIS